MLLDSLFFRVCDWCVSTTFAFRLVSSCEHIIQILSGGEKTQLLSIFSQFLISVFVRCMYTLSSYYYECYTYDSLPTTTILTYTFFLLIHTLSGEPCTHCILGSTTHAKYLSSKNVDWLTSIHHDQDRTTLYEALVPLPSEMWLASNFVRRRSLLGFSFE